MNAAIIRWSPGVRRWPESLAKSECTCGCKAVHVVSRRLTYDGKVVLLASDGTIAVEWKRIARVELEVGWRVMGDVEGYDAVDIEDVIKMYHRRALDRAQRTREGQ